VTRPRSGALLAANFAPGTGYAWDTIEQVFRGLSTRWIGDGREVYIGYPSLPPSASPVQGTTARLLEIDVLGAARSVAAYFRLLRAVRRHRIGLLYLTDQPTWSIRYPALFLAGVRTIVIHDRTSGARTPRSGLLAMIKRLLHRVPGLSATAFVGVSQFVVERLIRGGTPPERTHLVYNGIVIERFLDQGDGALAAAIGVPSETPIVFASARAQPYKGIQVLVEAAARLAADGDQTTHFAYCGDGSGRPALEARAAELGLQRFHFLGKRRDVPALLASATVAVVPSIWGEAFGLTVVEAMAAGVPVVCSAVGGIPELIDEDATGRLVPPGDPVALAEALRRLLDDAPARERMSRNGRRVASERFSLDRVVSELGELIDRVEARR
jgi:glycosyltransferase involved in cell wall biosynthesis